MRRGGDCIMKKYIKPLLIISVVLVFALGIKLFYNYNHVDGSFLSNYIAEKGITGITITMQKANRDIIKEVDLDKNQMHELISLFNDTTFVRHISSTTQYEDKTTYRMIGRTDDGKELLQLLAQGEESMFVAVIVDKQAPQTLLIQNGEWKTIIEGILAN